MKALIELQEKIESARDSWEVQFLLAEFYKSGKLKKCAAFASLMIQGLEAMEGNYEVIEER